MTINLGILSKYRVELMGLAAISIIICHAPGNKVMMPNVLKWICAFGQYGVDVFLFLSGFGLWYSLEKQSKNKKLNVLRWYSRRFIRLLVPYLVISVPYYLFFCLIKGESLINWPYYVSTLSFWTEHQGQWFVDALIPLYLLSPLLYMLLKKTNNSLLVVLMLIIVILGLSMLPSDANYYHTIYGNIRFVLIRIPSFILGMWLAPYIQQDVKIYHAELYVIASMILYVVTCLVCGGG